MSVPSVLVLEPGTRLWRLVSRCLTAHGVQTRLAAGRFELKVALLLEQYTCVIAGPDLDDDSVIADLCMDAGVPLVIAARVSGPKLIGRIIAVTRVRSDL